MADFDAVREFLAGFGVQGRRVREALALLTEGPHDVESLVRACALPRRTAEGLLRVVQPHLDADGALPVDYRGEFGYDQLRATALADPLAVRLAEHAGLVGELAGLIEAAPSGVAALDHVSATAETVVRRALWLAGTLDLDGANVLCVGDHDLTSLALRAVLPGAGVAVSDVDDRLLEFLAERGVRGWWSDFRFGLAEPVTGWADVVVTDPPYTPEGVRLFLGRGLGALRDRVNGRLVLAYGYSPLHPALGLKVQRAAQDLDLVAEAMLPAFNRYHGAQAVGSASDLYVYRPTARAWQILDRQLAGAAVGVYTHGGQSVESAAEVVDFTGVPAGQVLSGPVRGEQVSADLRGDPGGWLLRALLGVTAERVRLLVANAHPDLVSERAQRELAALVGAKYALRLLRSTPTPRTAVVEATLVEPETVAAHLLRRAHGKVANGWREGLVAARGLTKNEARAAIAESPVDGAWLDARLVDLPRSALARLLAATG